MMLVDNVAENFALQNDNGIFIKSWYDDMEDTELTKLTPLLKQIVISKVSDLRVTLRAFRDHMSRLITQGIKDPISHFSFT